GFQLWSSFREYKLVPSVAGKFPTLAAKPEKEAGKVAPLVGKKFAGKPGVLPNNATAEVLTPRLYSVTLSGIVLLGSATNAACSGVRSPLEGTPGGRKGANPAGAATGISPKLFAPMLENPVS